MIFELVIFAGSCHGQACRLERPLLERRPVRSVLVRVERETKVDVTRERKLRRTIKRR